MGGGEFEQGMLSRQTCATGLSESTQKTVTLLKSTFKLEHVNPSGIILCQEVRELCTLYVYIFIFM